MSHRSSLFASPARKTSRLECLPEPIVDKLQVEEEEEPMDIDATLQQSCNQIENTINGTNATEPCGSSGETPKRQRTLSMGRRRSICFSDEGKTPRDESKKVERSQQISTKQDESVFDLLMSESVLHSQSNPMHGLAAENRKCMSYYKELEKQLERFSVLADTYEKKLELACKKAVQKHISPFYQEAAQSDFSIISKSNEGLAPSQLVMKSLVEFRKLAKDTSAQIKLGKEKELAEEKNEKSKAKLAALENLKIKYALSSEEIAKRDAQKQELLQRLENIKNLGNPRKIEPFFFLTQ